MRKTNVAVVTAVKTVEFQEFDVPAVGPNEVIYQLKSCSLCTVEQRAYSGAKNFGFPFLGGHETAGIVVEVGSDVMDFQVGDHVVATFNYCGQCENCKRGRGTQCKYGLKAKKRIPTFPGTIIGGGLSEYLCVQAQQLVKVDKNVPFDHIALTEPLACCIHSVEKAKIEFGDNVVIIGAGIMGLLQAHLARLQGARVIISDPDEARRQKALDLGAHIAINPMEQNLVDTVKELTDGVGAAVVINTIPFTQIWEDAMNILAPYGRLIAYSSQDRPEPVEISFEKLHNKEYEYIGTVSPTMESNLKATKMITYGLIDMEQFIDSRYSHAETQKAFDRAIVPNTYRVIIHLNEDK